MDALTRKILEAAQAKKLKRMAEDNTLSKVPTKKPEKENYNFEIKSIIEKFETTKAENSSTTATPKCCPKEEKEEENPPRAKDYGVEDSLSSLTETSNGSTAQCKDILPYPEISDESNSTITSSICDMSYDKTNDGNVKLLDKKDKLPRPVIVDSMQNENTEKFAPIEPTSPVIKFPSTPNTPKLFISESPSSKLNRNNNKNTPKIAPESIPSTTDNSRTRGESKMAENICKFKQCRSVDVNALSSIESSISVSNLNRFGTASHFSSGSNASEDNICLIHNEEPYHHKLKECKKNIFQFNSIVQQASQALKTGYAKFKNGQQITPEIIEAEKLLLIATLKRDMLQEYELFLNDRNIPCICSGDISCQYHATVTIKDISLYVKSDYFTSEIKEAGPIYFCLILSANHQMHCSPAMSIFNVEKDIIFFKTCAKFENLSLDDTIRLQLFTFDHSNTSKELSRNSSIRSKGFKLVRISLTPKRASSRKISSTGDSTPTPAPNRSSNFTHVGEADIPIEKSGNVKLAFKNFSLEIPITKNFTLSLYTELHNECNAKGFITILNCINKIGGWQRHWCGVYRENMTLWKYPSDEKIKPPMYKLGLKWVSTGAIRLLSTNECARENTFEVAFYESDPNIAKGRVVRKYWLAADSKEERDTWMEVLNNHMRRYLTEKKNSSASV